MAELIDVSMNNYHALPRISKSRLDNIHRSPQHYKYVLDNPADPTQAMIEGSIFHKLVLEPDTFDLEYAVMPEIIDRRTKDGKAAWEAFCAECGDRISVQKPTLTQLTAQADSLRACSIAKNLLSNGNAEQSIVWDFGGYHKPIPAKCRIDFINTHCLVDLKTTIDARPDAFSRSCWNYRYHVQAAFYIDAYKELTGEELQFVFIAVEKTPPYGVAVYMANDEMVEQGRREYRQDLDIYAECLKTDEWPGYPGEIQEILLSTWAREDY